MYIEISILINQTPPPIPGGIGFVRPNYTFALKVGPFALIIKKYFNEHNGYFYLKYKSNDI